MEFNDIKNLTAVSDTWNFVAENETTWTKVKRQYLSSFRNVDSNFMSRMNLLDIDHYSAEIDRLHGKFKIGVPHLTFEKAYSVFRYTRFNGNN